MYEKNLMSLVLETVDGFSDNIILTWLTVDGKHYVLESSCTKEERDAFFNLINNIYVHPKEVSGYVLTTTKFFRRKHVDKYDIDWVEI